MLRVVKIHHYIFTMGLCEMIVPFVAGNLMIPLICGCWHESRVRDVMCPCVEFEINEF